MKAKKIEWNLEKNDQLKKERGVCFEDVENAINDNRLLDILPHHNPEKYPNQKILVHQTVKVRDYKMNQSVNLRSIQTQIKSRLFTI